MVHLRFNRYFLRKKGRSNNRMLLTLVLQNCNNTVFQLHNVIKKREKGGNLFELQISGFEIQAGELIAIVGESGCGKSTLLDMLGLALTPTSAEEFIIRIPLMDLGLPTSQYYGTSAGQVFAFFSTAAN